MLLWAGLLILFWTRSESSGVAGKRMGGLLASTLVVSLLGGLFLVDVLSLRVAATPSLSVRPGVRIA
ncbi:MAG: hypothetical protein CM1200mP2_12080 [Planctomycetaceae bacterium]|nr:MAG: hypothetical protein CM1200mP2_12080 [Planctomycetaceae bacterium]